MNKYVAWTSPALVKPIANRLRIALPDSQVFEGTERVWIFSSLSIEQIRGNLRNELPWLNLHYVGQLATDAAWQ